VLGNGVQEARGEVRVVEAFGPGEGLVVSAQDGDGLARLAVSARRALGVAQRLARGVEGPLDVVRPALEQVQLGLVVAVGAGFGDRLSRVLGREVVAARALHFAVHHVR